MSYRSRLRSAAITNVVLIIGMWFSAPPGIAQASQIQKLPEKRQQRIYSLLDQIQNAYSNSENSALKICNSAIAEFPQIGEFYLRRGQAYVSLGNDTKAIADFRHARACDSTLANSAAELSSAVFCNQKKYDQALKEFDSLPINALGFRGDPSTRIKILILMGNRTLAESTFRQYRKQMLAKGQWSDIYKNRFPEFENLTLETPQPNISHSTEAISIIKRLAAFKTTPSKSQIEEMLGIKLVSGKAFKRSKSSLIGNGGFYKVFVDEESNSVEFSVLDNASFIAAKDLLNDLNYAGAISDDTFCYTIRRTASAPQIISLVFSGDYKGLSSASFTWNVVPDSPNPIQVRGDSPAMLTVLQELDAFPQPIDKCQFELITKCKLKQTKNIYPNFYSGKTETEVVWRSSNGFRSQNSWSVNYTPNGAYLNDTCFYVAPGAEKVTRNGLDSLFGTGNELSPKNDEWRVDSSESVSYKRPYGSITAVFRNEGAEKVASSIWFWRKRNTIDATLEEFETKRTSAVLLENATEAMRKNEFRNSAYLLRLAYWRGGFSEHSGQQKYDLWQNIRSAYGDLYAKKGDANRAAYLRNVTCSKMNSDLLELEGQKLDFPTLKEAQTIPWQITHAPESTSYRLKGDKTAIEIYKSPPNFQRCLELFGQMNSGEDKFVHTIPADLFDSEYFGPAYYD